MYYVFFDTVDLNFIIRIARRYCPYVFNQLFQECYQAMQPHDPMDAKELKMYFKTGNGKSLAFLNCCVHLAANCSCTDCRDEHTSVLASDQLKCLGDELENLKSDFIKYLKKIDPGNQEELKRLAFQRMCQTFANSMLDIERIRIQDEYLTNHGEYLRQYAVVAAGYKRQKPKGFMYVRADVINSDYAAFAAGINLPNLTPCDTIAPLV